MAYEWKFETCDYYDIHEARGPHDMTAVISIVNCGATVAYSTAVFLRVGDAPIDRTAPLFLMAGEGLVNATWNDAKTLNEISSLTIMYGKTERIFQQVSIRNAMPIYFVEQ